MSTAFNTRPVLGFITEGTTFAIMLGLTFASAAALALPAGPRTPLAATEAATPVAAAKLSKEERMRIQKEKNREAAQRSRDQHKEYVNKL